MSKTIQDKAHAHAWHEQHDPHAPKKGDPAPDFELCDANGENPVRLSDVYKDKPVALVFGSFT